MQSFVEDPANPPDVWAHAQFEAELDRISFTGPAIYRGAMRQFGNFVPVVSAGIGPALNFDNNEQSTGVLLPTHYLTGDRMDVTINGMLP